MGQRSSRTCDSSGMRATKGKISVGVRPGRHPGQAGRPLASRDAPLQVRRITVIVFSTLAESCQGCCCWQRRPERRMFHRSAVSSSLLGSHICIQLLAGIVPAPCNSSHCNRFNSVASSVGVCELVPFAASRQQVGPLRPGDRAEAPMSRTRIRGRPARAVTRCVNKVGRSRRHREVVRAMTARGHT